MLIIILTSCNRFKYLVRKSIRLRTSRKLLISIYVYIRKSSKTIFGRSVIYIYLYERFFIMELKTNMKIG